MRRLRGLDEAAVEELALQLRRAPGEHPRDDHERHHREHYQRDQVRPDRGRK